MKYTFKGFCKEYFRRMNLWGYKTKTHYSERLLREEAKELEKKNKPDK